MIKSKNKLKGSAILIVILSSVIFTIYASSTYVEEQHFKIMQQKYENNIIKYYEKDINNIHEIYEELVNINKINNI